MQTVVYITLASSLVMFFWGKLRYDIVALIALFIIAIFKIIPAEQIFTGFGHPAVITVAAVMIISKGMQNSGVVDILARSLLKLQSSNFIQIIVLCSITAIASSFMNNVGALAIMMPVAIQSSRKNGIPVSHLLMPLAFSSLLGGMMTMIGTPPNIIIASYRAGTELAPFRMFDFVYIGLPVTIIGIMFISLFGWRLLPYRKGQKKTTELFQIDDYITEVRVTKESKMLDVTIGDLSELDGIDVSILGMVRNGRRIHIPDTTEELLHNDIVILEADPENLKSFVDLTGFELVGEKKFRKDAKGSKDINVKEAIVMKDSRLIGKTASGINLRSRYGVNLLAIARSNVRMKNRIDRIKFKVGDVLLLQGRNHVIDDTVSSLGCLPLAERGLRIHHKTHSVLASSVFAVAILVSVTGLLSAPVSFSIAALIYVLVNIVSFRDVYSEIDWPVIILLAAMIPVGKAFEVSGAAETVAHQLVHLSSGYSLWITLTLLTAITMVLSNIINNVATAVLMAPIGVIIASNLNVSADPFLMSVALGASSPFLTPIGHQSNTLVMAPGGYRFGDYWRMGLPLQILILSIGIPLIIFFWAR